MTLLEVFRECSNRQIRLSVVQGGAKLKFVPVDQVNAELLEGLRELKQGIIQTIERSSGLPPCRHCEGQLFAVLTFDGFENLECFECGECAGCRPATVEAIKKYGGQ